jgi:hypothetical protein
MDYIYGIHNLQQTLQVISVFIWIKYVNFLLYYGYRCIYHIVKHLNTKQWNIQNLIKDNYDSAYSNIHYSPQSHVDCVPLWSAMVCGV